MFFFIGGIQPKTRQIDQERRMCPSCGLYQARLKRVDHYISLFFVPLLKVKEGVPFLQCERCGKISPESEGPVAAEEALRSGNCPYCGKSIEAGFRFCPHCGKSMV
jgi:RNA polymerase subunit RPABC4/transcription elongation factor Spt4